MICTNCGGTYEEKKGTLEFPDEIVGVLSVPNVEFGKCPKCSGLLLPPEAIGEIERLRERCIATIVGGFPVRDFVFPSEAIKILGVSRQAFHSNRHIQRGFIYSVLRDGKRLYLKRSVELFRQNGDGRFPLAEEWGGKAIVSSQVKYLDFKKAIASHARDLYAERYSSTKKEVLNYAK